MIISDLRLLLVKGKGEIVLTHAGVYLAWIADLLELNNIAMCIQTFQQNR